MTNKTKTKSTITLTITLDHGENKSVIDIVRTLVNRFHDHSDNDMELREVQDNCTTYYRFVVHDGNYGREFTFYTVDEFIERYAKLEPCTFQYMLNDYGRFESCNCLTETEVIPEETK